MLTLSKRAVLGGRLYLRLNLARRKFQTARMNRFAATEYLVEISAALAYVEGRPMPIKALIAEVSPDWISTASALRLVHRLVRSGMFIIETDPRDRRTKLVQPTRKLIGRLERFWEFTFRENAIPREMKEQKIL